MRLSHCCVMRLSLPHAKDRNKDFNPNSEIGLHKRGIHAAFSFGESNFGEVGVGHCKRLLNSGFRCE
jgi:hypothetical protein